MNKKLLAIQVLKQRMVTMQQQLTKLQKQKQKPKKTISKPNDHLSSPIRNTTSNKGYKSPTFWTGNAVLGQQNPYFSHKNISPKRKPERNMSFTSKSPVLQKIKKDVDLNFYHSLSAEKQNKTNVQSAKQSNEVKFNKTKQNKILQLFNSTPKIQKVKTYDLPKKDPILNPEPAKVSSKKITHPQLRSPSNMFIENPNSNPNLYFSSSSQAIRLSPKGQNNRNKSSGLKLILSSSLENLQVNSTPKSSKKHFNKYFEDNLTSKWGF